MAIVHYGSAQDCDQFLLIVLLEGVQTVQRAKGAKITGFPTSHLSIGEQGVAEPVPVSMSI